MKCNMISAGQAHGRAFDDRLAPEIRNSPVSARHAAMAAEKQLCIDHSRQNSF